MFCNALRILAMDRCVFLVFLASCHLVWGLPRSHDFPQRDDECAALGGECVDWRYYVCHAGVVTGVCPGDSNMRCCLGCDQACEDAEESYSEDDGQCLAVDGVCMDNSNYCAGAYTGGKCGGPSARQCCQKIEEECAAIVRSIQEYHMESNGWSDIGYSFLVGGDGNIYEGRGWNVLGAHTQSYNDVGYGTCFIGNFMTVEPEDEAVDVYFELLDCAIIQGKVVSGYELYGHRQVGSTDCPGDTLYDLIQSWPHWTSGSPS